MMPKTYTTSMTEPTTHTTPSQTQSAPAHSASRRGREALPSEDEICSLFLTEYRDGDPRCAILVKQIMECHRIKNSSERRKIVEAIKVGNEWQRIAPTWRKFYDRALVRSAFSRSPTKPLDHGAEAVPVQPEGSSDPASGAGSPPSDPSGGAQEVPLADIDLDCAIRVREKLNQDVVDHYCDLIKRGVALPPIKIFRVGGVLKVTDGQHRCRGAAKAGRETIQAIIIEGSEKDALKDALGANAQHGLPRSNKDKRRVAILGIQNFGHLSDREIAAICQVSNTFIGEVRAQLSTADSSQPRTGKDGKARRLPRRKAATTKAPSTREAPADAPETQESTPDHELPGAHLPSGGETDAEKSHPENPPETGNDHSVNAVWRSLTALLEKRIPALSGDERAELAELLVTYADELRNRQD